eukprot:TRINITY_DN7139_c0_g1_i2.p1 TRINITY_DN7139_c0_g1~~TRINITY_DN7139_c0_g1_i2.p1  ORF type:complete len:217 (-),score=7.85 TRINITY_DN7139_c0_g1_i2:116-712(-)
MGHIWDAIQNSRLLLNIYGGLQNRLLYVYPIDREYWNADLIVDHLWLGDVWSAYNTHQLTERGIKTVLTAIGGFKALESDTITESRCYDWLDTPRQSIIDEIRHATEYIHHAIQRGDTVLVHCRKGRSRSASIVIAYLMRYHNMTYDIALEHTRGRRPIIQPNEGFQQQLRAYQQQLADSPSPPLTGTCGCAYQQVLV